MIKLIPTSDARLITSVFELDPDLKHIYLLIDINSVVVGMFEIQPLSKICGNLHLHIKEKYQKCGIGPRAFIELLEYLQDKQFTQLVAMIPAKNSHIMSMVNKTQGKCCGLIKDSIIWNKELQDLLLFQLKIK